MISTTRRYSDGHSAF